jgi:hypothetical protein
MRLVLCLLICFARFAVTAQTWQDALAQMPLGTNVAQLNETNCIKLLLPAFGSNDVVKALIFMPGATDEFYMFHRAKADLTNASPTLLDAVNALTNQTFIKVTFHPPFLLLHTDEDPLIPLEVTNHQKTADKIAARKFIPHGVFYDKDWDFMEPVLEKYLHVSFFPWLRSRDSWHFYRHSFAAWNLNGHEALEAVALAGKTKFTIERSRVVFEGDERIWAQPNLENYRPKAISQPAKN